MKLIIASNNQHKVEEIRSVLPATLKLLSLKEAGIEIEIPEPYDTLQENAAEKARTIYALTGENCFGEDTGLEIYALQNEPGVKSARYAQNEPEFRNNIEKLLFKLKDETNRSGRFRTVICLIVEGKEHFFEGICEGMILYQPKGEKGFGYDPIFQPDGASICFAEMDMEEKNLYSHRARAMGALVTFLKQNI
ncbi:MAG: RdgB/HAM1 family non-canonical purine NTP pyrophosphatase [Flavisolibacter sp.]|jgi:XTP/dITP diphosphohydrolase|nr:RdgB/HAM1 family non-canonical purine NTP pyrophosphatase [Flavisolibacter sp.]